MILSHRVDLSESNCTIVIDQSLKIKTKYMQKINLTNFCHSLDPLIEFTEILPF